VQTYEPVERANTKKNKKRKTKNKKEKGTIMTVK
jgi:hypothetical protein